MKCVTRILLVSLLIGSNSPAEAASRDAELYDAIRGVGLDPETIAAPLRLTDEMKSWVEDQIPGALDPADKMQRLLRGLLLEDGLGVKYRVGYTGTAEEVFATRYGNCLAFTQMFVAMGREVGVDVYYLAVDQVTNFRKESDLIIVSDHVTAAFDEGANRRVLEFSLLPDFDYRSARRIDDVAALALYYSNRGAELVQKQEFEAAVTQLETAVKLAPSLGQAWVNLGVARRRLGDLEGAEADYHRAIEADVNQLSAYHNLVGLYQLRGENDPAGAILEMLDRRDNRNPFVFLQLGDLSRERDRGEEATRFYRRAVRLGSSHAETHAAYGLWHLEAGKIVKARRLLGRAEKRDPQESRTARLRERLAELE
jgi:tetratricopeptide (TPR) repeat protein